MDLDTIVNGYLAGGGTRPATFLRGFAEAGRFGVRGEGSHVPADAADDYAAGVEAAQAARAERAEPVEA